MQEDPTQLAGAIACGDMLIDFVVEGGDSSLCNSSVLTLSLLLLTGSLSLLLLTGSSTLCQNGCANITTLRMLERYDDGVEMNLIIKLMKMSCVNM